MLGDAYFMKKVFMFIYLLSFLSIFAGCAGKGFVLGRIEAVMLAGNESSSLMTNISQIPKSNQKKNIEEIAAVMELAVPEHSVYAQVAQAVILKEMASFPIGSFELGAIIGNVMTNTLADNTQKIAGHIAITFDDGPHPTLTPILLDALKERGIKATFFLLGQEVDRHPEIVARMHEEGHSIGNHSYRHPRFIDIGRQAIINEIESTNRSIKTATGSVPTLLRPPYGLRNSTVLDVARYMDMSVVLWSVDPRDWDHRNAPLVRDNIINYAVDGSVVLLHDIHETSVEAAIMAIDVMIERGYVFVTVEELFLLSELTLQAGKEYSSVYHSIGVLK